ncbi:hypothetical protein JKP88DRAFT_289626 [Tribonema minus]|uniref:Uncharacterized protein n=1 Tax=Tribonema minus TaxID=303371 RepID=A0A835Z7L2_9STRA|nr:hypothetical protein JKP88DRAFT_289626 [Tribonema minus]
MSAAAPDMSRSPPRTIAPPIPIRIAAAATSPRKRTATALSGGGSYSVFVGDPEHDAARFRRFQAFHGARFSSSDDLAATAAAAVAAKSVRHQFRALVGGGGGRGGAGGGVGGAGGEGGERAHGSLAHSTDLQGECAHGSLAHSTDLQLHFGREVLLRTAAADGGAGVSSSGGSSGGGGSSSSGAGSIGGGALAVDMGTGFACAVPLAATSDRHRCSFHLVDLEDIGSYKQNIVLGSRVWLLNIVFGSRNIVFGSRVWLLIEAGTGDPSWHQGSVLGARVHEPGALPTIKLRAGADQDGSMLGARVHEPGALPTIKLRAGADQMPSSITAAAADARRESPLPRLHAAQRSSTSGAPAPHSSVPPPPPSGGARAGAAAAAEPRVVGMPRPVRSAVPRGSDAQGGGFGEQYMRMRNADAVNIAHWILRPVTAEGIALPDKMGQVVCNLDHCYLEQDFFYITFDPVTGAALLRELRPSSGGGSGGSRGGSRGGGSGGGGGRGAGSSGSGSSSSGAAACPVVDKRGIFRLQTTEKTDLARPAKEQASMQLMSKARRQLQRSAVTRQRRCTFMRQRHSTTDTLASTRSAATRQGRRTYMRQGEPHETLRSGGAFARGVRAATARAATASAAAALSPHVNKELSRFATVLSAATASADAALSPHVNKEVHAAATVLGPWFQDLLAEELLDVPGFMPGALAPGGGSVLDSVSSSLWFSSASTPSMSERARSWRSIGAQHSSSANPRSSSSSAQPGSSGSSAYGAAAGAAAQAAPGSGSGGGGGGGSGGGASGSGDALEVSAECDVCSHPLMGAAAKFCLCRVNQDIQGELLRHGALHEGGSDGDGSGGGSGGAAAGAARVVAPSPKAKSDSGGGSFVLVAGEARLGGALLLLPAAAATAADRDSASALTNASTHSNASAATSVPPSDDGSAADAPSAATAPAAAAAAAAAGRPPPGAKMLAQMSSVRATTLSSFAQQPSLTTGLVHWVFCMRRERETTRVRRKPPPDPFSAALAQLLATYNPDKIMESLERQDGVIRGIVHYDRELRDARRKGTMHGGSGGGSGAHGSLSTRVWLPSQRHLDNADADIEHRGGAAAGEHGRGGSSSGGGSSGGGSGGAAALKRVSEGLQRSEDSRRRSASSVADVAAAAAAWRGQHAAAAAAAAAPPPPVSVLRTPPRVRRPPPLGRLA